MQQTFTLSAGKVLRASLLTGMIWLFSFGSSSAQVFCTDEIVYWSENFGTGLLPTPHPDISPGSLTYQPLGSLSGEGTYRTVNNTQQMPEWHNSEDHTAGDVNGKMLVINGQSETFFSHITTRPTGFAAGNYAASLFLMNVNTPGTCAPNPLLPVINFTVEYLSANNTWIGLNNSPVSSSFVPQSANPTWVSLGGVFVLPATGNFTVTQIRITLSDGVTGGCGNDFAIDDIKLSSCPSGAPVPVQFLSVTARQKGSGISVNWSTASEINNHYFDVERSNNGGTDWLTVATVRSSNGNSNSTQQYSSYDAKPVTGNNLYRIRQVDLDGRFKFSPSVNVKLTAERTGISILTNPFSQSITADFLTNRAQQLVCRLTDAGGRTVYTQSFTAAKGSSRKVWNGLSQLSAGLYILQVTGDNGETIYTEKLIKQ